MAKNSSNIGDAQGWSAAAVRENRHQVLAFRVNSRVCSSWRVRPIFIIRSNVFKLATIYEGTFRGILISKSRTPNSAEC